METTDRYTEWLEGVKYLIYQRKKKKQTELAKTTGAGVQHVNAILKGRRKAGADLQDAISRALGMSYDHVRQLGACLLHGADGEVVLKNLRILASREDPATRHVDGASVGVAWGNNNGTVAGVVNAAPFNSPPTRRRHHQQLVPADPGSHGRAGYGPADRTPGQGEAGAGRTVEIAWMYLNHCSGPAYRQSVWQNYAGSALRLFPETSAARHSLVCWRYILHDSRF